MKKTKPRVVVITGASAGLGRAIARAFASEQAHLGLLARGVDGLDATRRDVEARGGQAAAFSVDVSNAAEVEAAAGAVEEKFGPIDVWVNNAMVSVFSPVKDMTAGEYKRVTEVTYLGYVYGTLSALRRMRARDQGVIVQVGSALAYRGIPLQSAYCAAKHAIQGFCDSLRCELLHDNSKIRVVMVHMPAMNTPQFGWVKSRLPNRPQPVPPIYEPEVGARAVLFASRNSGREMYVGYPTFEAIVGDKIAPGLMDRYLSGHGYEAQQTNEPDDPKRQNNLWSPVPGDHGPHGAFTGKAARSSPLLWLRMHRQAIAIAAAGLALIGLVQVGKAQAR
jgi:NAD(P)-dependent dehydrogenase (short-subunit alcohol dehydrogenase family)